MKWDEMQSDDLFCTLNDDNNVPLGQVSKDIMGTWTAFSYAGAKRTRLGNFPLLEKAKEAVENDQGRQTRRDIGTLHRNMT